MAARKRFTAEQARNILLNSHSDEDSYESDQMDEEDSGSDYDPPINQSAESSSESQVGDVTDASDNENESLEVVAGRQSAQESDADESGEYDVVLMSKDKKVAWHSAPLRGAQGRRAAANVMHSNPGPTRYALRNVDTPASALGLFLREPLLIEIMKWTNKEGEAVFGDNWKILEHEELLCYIGLLLLAGVYKARNEPVAQLWSTNSGRPLFSQSMPRTRFTNIARVLRFDDAASRRQRRETDKLAPIRNVFDMWQLTLEDAFVPFENVTCDEQLLTFRGRCPFKQYIPSKPGKYGIKLWMLSDSQTSYVCRLQVYTGQQGDAREINQGKRVVTDLCSSLKGTGRNVTCDNFFTSLNLLQQLKKDNLTVLGTVRKNRVELPPELVATRGREALSSKFAFHKDAMLVSYCPKKGKVVVLMSSLHDQANIDEANPKKKPSMILDYNSTKGGVDTSDQMLRTYTCKRMTRRWPIAIFSNMLDISALNAYIIWMLINPDWNAKKTHKRRLFIEELGKVCLILHIQRLHFEFQISFIFSVKLL